MKNPVTNPVFWRLDTLLSIGIDELDQLARTAVGTVTSYRLVVGRCLLALDHNRGYKEYGCSSAMHYATAILGMSRRGAGVCRRVARRLKDLPELTLAAEQGTIEWAKLREIVRKASPETELFWLKLAETHCYKKIQRLVSQTPVGALPGDVDEDSTTLTSELRCSLSDAAFAMLSRARRMYSLEKGEVVTSAQVVEWALASYISSQPLDSEVLEKVRQEANKDLQAERARNTPLVANAREIAEEMGLFTSGDPESCEDEEPEPLALALGAEPMPDTMPEPPKSSTHNEPNRPARVTDLVTWQNTRLRYNPRNRHTTKAQKKEILRRDGCCQTPGCPNTVWVHLHHLKPYSKGGQTEPSNLICLCSGCHRNLHKGLLRITPDSKGNLVFRDRHGRRLDRHADLELAGWLDYWLGWKGQMRDSHSERIHSGRWRAFACS
jgi:HNH endonuclease